MKLPRIMIAAPGSGCGKTMLTCGLLQLLKRKQYHPAAFKCGPDYIDPMFHAKVIGTNSGNLDSFFAGKETLEMLLAERSAGCGIAVLEGAMGYYDGLASMSTKASACDIAKLTQTPVLLLVDVRGMGNSVVALIRGFLEYRQPAQIKGVVLNRISPALYPKMKQLIEQELPVKVAGYIPKLEREFLKSRHLGLVMPGEIAQLQEELENLADILEKSIDVKRLLAIAQAAPELPDTLAHCKERGSYNVTVAVARDEAFCFYYEENLTLLKKMGAKIVEFSPVHDQKLPEEADGMILPGGYPELYADVLGKNAAMKNCVKDAVAHGMPCIAECGGFLYLHECMENTSKVSFPMAGVLAAKAHYTGKLSRFGYITLQGGTFFGENIGEVAAHEFHYYDSSQCGEAFTAIKPLSGRSWKCIHSSDTLLAGFPHFYFYANKKLPEAFLRACETYSARKRSGGGCSI